MFFLGYGWQRRLQKTHDRCQPWVLVKFAVQQAPTASLTTTTTGKVTTCELNLNIDKKNNSSAAEGQARISRQKSFANFRDKPVSPDIVTGLS